MVGHVGSGSPALSALLTSLIWPGILNSKRCLDQNVVTNVSHIARGKFQKPLEENVLHSARALNMIQLHKIEKQPVLVHSYCIL